MPPGGHPARAEALATLSRVAHEKFVDDEIGRLLERLRPLEESLEYDSDDASLIRVTRRDWEKQRRVPTELRTEMTRAGGSRQPGLDRGAREERLRELPPGARAKPRAEAPLRRVLRVGRLAVHAAPRRLRAVHEDDRGGRDLRHDPAGPVRAREGGAARRRALPRPLVRPGSPARVLQPPPRHARIRGGLGPPGPDRPPVLHLVLEPRRASHDALQRDRARLDLVDDARGRPRPLRARHRALPPAHAARELALARPERVAEPHLGEPRRPQPRLLVALVRAAAGHLPGAARRRRPRDLPRRRSTAPSRGSSARRRTRRRTACTSSSGSSSSGS